MDEAGESTKLSFCFSPRPRVPASPHLRVSFLQEFTIGPVRDMMRQSAGAWGGMDRSIACCKAIFA
jgi:hypothetical protein